MQAKMTPDDLALFGGRSAFDAKLHVGSPNLGKRDTLFRRMNDMLDRRWLTNYGPFVQEFEQRLAAFLVVKHCIVVCNATVGLGVAARAADLTGEVIVPSFTFIATAHALSWLNLTPVFCDVNPASHNLDPSLIEPLITPRTSGIVGVHVWGRACEVERLQALADKHRLKLLFDAAHAFGCSYKNRMIGNFGLAEVFSFHATKFINSFEGGAIATNDDAMAERIRLMVNFGFAGYDHVAVAGTNAKMSEPCAIMGLNSLESIDDIIAVNRRNYLEYAQLLSRVPGIKVIEYPADEKNNFQYVVAEIDAKEAGLSRNDIKDILWAENVLARRYFYPACHRMAAYQAIETYRSVRLPHSEQLSERVIALPTGTAVSLSDVHTVCEIIRVAVANGPAVRARIAEIRFRGR